MRVDINRFLKTSMETMDNQGLHTAYESAMSRFRANRDNAYTQVPDIEELRDELKQIRSALIAALGTHLLTFEHKAREAGAIVHWARDAAEVNQIVLGIANERGTKLVAKSKSMVTEEVHLNQALEHVGIEVVETDLGEYIIQLAGERPSHIIAPAVHQTTESVAELFTSKLGKQMEKTPEALTAAARSKLRQVFLEAGIGISGANFGVAETGSVVLVTNEGNGRMVTSLPPVHIAVMGIERLAPDWDAAAVWLSLLARSATGQALSIYTSVITGPARGEDIDGPEEVHIILLDNKRSTLVDTRYEEVLQCIRCGSCLGVCPVYLQTGGHAYHSPYSGPIGAVISPLLFGHEEYAALPQASTLCNACLEVCPVRIDLPRMLLALREDSVEQGIIPLPVQAAERISARMLSRPWLMRIFFEMGRFGQLMIRLFGLKLDGFENYPMVAGQPFRDLWPGLESDDDRQE